MRIGPNAPATSPNEVTRIMAAGDDRSGPSPPARWVPRWPQNLAAVNFLVLAALALWAVVWLGPGTRVGDAHEYYLMLIDWAENFTPYSTDRTGALYEAYVDTRPDWHGHEVYFPGWPPRPTVDCSHFWFYSLLAAFFYWPLKIAGIDVALSFNLLHAALLFLGAYVAHKHLGPLGTLSLILLVVCSPALWYINKAHTEWFTVVITATAMVYFLVEKHHLSALWFAVASTQNPPFAVLALTVVAIGSVREGRRFWRAHKGTLAGAAALAALHPVYYLLRRGALLSLGASDLQLRQAAYHVRCMLAYWVDPDIGMFANWLPALPMVMLFALLWAKGAVPVRRRTAVLALVAILLLGWTHTLTTNVNHGGTVHISRYCLWFLFLFFGVQWRLLVWLAGRRRLARSLGVAAAAVAGVFTAWQYHPGRPEICLAPTAVSRLLYARLPGLYDPLPEVFYARHGGQVTYGDTEEGVEWFRWTTWAVSDASGNKILIVAEAMDREDPQAVRPVVGCAALDARAVYRRARQHFLDRPGRRRLYLNGLARSLSQSESKRTGRVPLPAPREHSNDKGARR
jgi:hypothetical protein